MLSLNLFKTMPSIKDILYLEDYIFTGIELLGSVSFQESVNAGEDLEIGSCVISEIEFQLQDLNYLINEISGKEIVWKQAVRTGVEEYAALARAASSNLIVVNGDVAYSASSNSLSVWDINTTSKIEDVSSPSSQDIKGLIVYGNILYCLHDVTPYATLYTISNNGKTLSLSSSPSFNSFYQQKIMSLCALSKSLNVQGDIIKEYQIELYNLRPRNLFESTYECLQRGVFTAEKPTKTNDTRIRVKCYDNLNKFEVYVDDYVNSDIYPITLKAYLQGLCAYVGVEYSDSTFTNQNYSIPQNFLAENITGTQVLRYIMEVAASFGRIDSSGKFRVGWYSPVDFMVDNSIYVSASTEDYVTKTIDKVQARSNSNDIGVIVPPDEQGTNIYIIENNPLLYAESDAELRPTIENIYNVIKSIAYRPYSLLLRWGIPMLHAGDIISVKTRNGLAFQAYIMTRSLKQSADTFSAEGNEQREVQSDAVNQSIQQLRGKSNELTRTIEETNSRLTDTANQLESEIRQTAESITATVTDVKNDLQSQIDIQAGEIASKVSEEDVSSIIRQSPTDVVFAFNNGDGQQWIKMTGDGFDFYSGNTFIGSMGVRSGQLNWEVAETSSMTWNPNSVYPMWWNAGDRAEMEGSEGGFHSQAVYCDLLVINSRSSARVNFNDHDLLNGGTFHIQSAICDEVDTNDLYVSGTHFTRTRFTTGDGKVYFGLLASVDSLNLQEDDLDSIDLLREIELQKEGD